MRNNIVTAVAGEKLYIKTDPVFQYDYGLKLVISGVALPETYDAHFGNTNSASAKTVTGDNTGLEIPDEYLRNGEDVHAWLYLHVGEDDGETVLHIHIPVISRAAIDDEEITPIEHHAIEIALEQMNEAVQQTESNVAHYPYISQDGYWMVWDAQNDRFNNTEIKAAANNISIYDTQTDQPTVEIYDAAAGDVTEFIVAITPIQAGSGNPGPRNIRTISGFSKMIIDQLKGQDGILYMFNFESNIGKVYNGRYNALTGKLFIDSVLVTKRCVDMDNSEVRPGWRNSGIREILGEGVDTVYTNQILNIGTSFGVDTTGENDLLYLGLEQYGMRQQAWINTEINVQILVPLSTPIEYDVASIEIATGLGRNRFSANTGNILSITYPCDTKLYIDHKIAELQALVLEN